jgi:hypothetical protein
VLLQLFWIVFLPISTSLWIRIEARETVMIMGANLMLIAVSSLLIWVYSCQRGLRVPDSIVAELVGWIFRAFSVRHFFGRRAVESSSCRKTLVERVCDPFCLPSRSTRSSCGEDAVDSSGFSAG